MTAISINENGFEPFVYMKIVQTCTKRSFLNILEKMR